MLSRPQFRGFTVVEVVLSLGIVAILLLSVIALFTRGMVVLSHSKQVSAATDAAEECMETIKAGGPSLIAAGLYDGRADDPVDLGTGFPPSPYPRTTEGFPVVVQATTAGAPAGTMAILVEVYYESAQKVILQTYLPL